MTSKHGIASKGASMMKLARTAAAAGALAIGAPALAVDIPPAQTGAGYQVTNVMTGDTRYENLYGDASQVLISQNSIPTPGIPYVRSEANPFGVVSAYSNAASVEGYHITGSSFISYSFTVLGDEGYAGLIPIGYTAHLSAVASGDPSHNVAVADAQLYIAALGQATSYRAAVCTSGCVGDQPSSLAISDTVFTRTDDIVYVNLSSSTEAINFGSAIAYADPYFFIDPSFLADHAGFSLQFSPNVGNDPSPAAVPEPASWALLIAGAGLVGGALRRRRKQGAVFGFA